jgi:ribosomal protein S18 acetylase RimI-like enzyme
MEANLHLLGRPSPLRDEGISLLPWSKSLVRDHAKAKFESFRDEMDASVFPCLGRKDGCLQLMNDLASRNDFVPESTWLAVHQATGDKNSLPVGTIQGLRVDREHGSIQNIGIIPSFRGLGIGSTLIIKALAGFAAVGCKTASLEVTVQNFGAIRLYEKLGFRRADVVFKVGEVLFG